jgi:hypothetical protein
MKSEGPGYRRLPGARRNLFRKDTLWRAADHLLSVESYRFSEEYKRYYFKDIQAIVIRQTSAAGVLSRSLTLLAMAGLAAILYARRDSLWVTIPAALLLLGFSILKLRGPKCVCHVITAVSMDRIPALYRLKTAEKTLRIVQPLIEEAQREPAPPPAVEQARAEQAP